MVPVVPHKGVKVICVGVFVNVLAGPVDVGRHVFSTAERLVVHVVCIVFTASETTIHTLKSQDGEKEM